MNRSSMIAGFLALMLLLVYAFTFTVGEAEKAIKIQLGRIVETDYSPGLHFRVPMLQRVERFDARVLTFDAQAERVLTVEKKNMIVDAFVKWRIADPATFFTQTSGDESRATTLLQQVVRKGVLDAFGKRTVQEVIADQREEIMLEVRSNVNVRANELGIELVDVRLKKVEWPDGVLSSVYSRMEKERATVAKRFRSEGEEQAKGIRADAARQRSELLADAFAEAESIRGDGDAQSAKIYAEAYGQNKEFYRLYRSLSAYRNTFADKSNVLLLRPDSEFFRYFEQSTASPTAPSN